VQNTESGKNKEKPPRTFMTDYWRKIIAFALAISVWWMISKQMESPYTVHNVRVNVEFEDDTLCLSRNMDYPHVAATLEIKSLFSGSRYQADDFEVEVVIPSVPNKSSEFLYDLKLDVNMVKRKPMPIFTKVESIQPTTPSIKLDVIKQKDVPVVVPEKGVVKVGYTTKKKIMPPLVRISGPSAQLNRVDKLDTEVLDLAREDLENVKALAISGILPPNVSILTPNVRAKRIVAVEIKVVREGELSRKEYKDLPVRLLSPLGGKLAVSGWGEAKTKVDVVLEGTQSMLNAFSSFEPMPYIDLGDASEIGTFKAKVKLTNIPEQYDRLVIKPEQIEVKLVEIKPDAAKPAVKPVNEQPIPKDARGAEKK